MLDTAVVPDRMFAAVNAIYELEAGFHGNGHFERDTNAELGAAISFQANQNVFIGGELRYLTKFERYFPVDAVGHGFFIGPTLSTFWKNAYAGIAWSTQISGHARAEPSRGLDLINYERHQVRLKAGFTF